MSRVAPMLIEPLNLILAGLCAAAAPAEPAPVKTGATVLSNPTASAAVSNRNFIFGFDRRRLLDLSTFPSPLLGFVIQRRQQILFRLLEDSIVAQPTI
jgi:hypothetical protein